MAGRSQETSEDLASQPTLSRFENRVSAKDLRRHLQGTDLATAQVSTLRLKLLKIGARIRETYRRLWVHLASGYPYRALLAGLLHNLRASPA